MPEFEFVKAYTAFECPEYICELEEWRRGEDQMVFIHVAFRKWSWAILKRCKKQFALFRQFVTCPLYACGETDDAKWEGFVRLFGFKFLNDAVCTDGKHRRIFIHLSDKKNVVRTTTINFLDKRTVETTAAVS